MLSSGIAKGCRSLVAVAVCTFIALHAHASPKNSNHARAKLYSAASDTPPLHLAVIPEAPPPSIPWWRHHAGLRIAAATLLTVGAVVIGVGSFSGAKADSVRSDLDRESGLDQIAARSTHQRAANAARQANTMWAAGAGLSSSGAALFLWDHYNTPPPAAPIVIIEPATNAGPAACTRDSGCDTGQQCINKVCTVVKVMKVAVATKSIEFGGLVVDKATGEPIFEGTVVISGFEASPLRTDPRSGVFRSWPIEVHEGLVKLTASAPGYVASEKLVSASAPRTTTQIVIELQRTGFVEQGLISGSLKDAKTGKALKGTVFIPATGFRVRSDKRGNFRAKVEPGQYQVLISSPRHVTQKKTIHVLAGEKVIINADLAREPN